MFNRRRNQLVRTLNEAALALVAEAQHRAPEDAACLEELATRIDEIRINLASERDQTSNSPATQRLRVAA